MLETATAQNVLILFLIEFGLHLLKFRELKWGWIQTKAEQNLALKRGKKSNCPGYRYSQEIAIQTSQIHKRDGLDTVSLSLNSILDWQDKD